MNAESQKLRILQYCDSHGSITAREAFEILEINSPRKRISEMRNSPFFDVETIWDSRVKADGTVAKFARYRIRAAKNQEGKGENLCLT